MNGLHLYPPAMPTQCIWIFDHHSLAVTSGHLLDDKWTRGFCIQLGELPLVPDDQLAWLKVRQGRGIHLGPLTLPSELLNSTLSLPDAVAPQLLEPCNNGADFGKISFFIIQSQLICQGGQSWNGQSWL